MQTDSAVWNLNRPERTKFGLLASAQVAALFASAGLAILGLAARYFPPVMSWMHLPVNAAVAGLACSIGLGISWGRRSRGKRAAIRIMAVATGLPALAAIATSPNGPFGAIKWLNQGMPPAVAMALLFLALLLFFLRSRTRVASLIADVAVFVLGWSVLTLVIHGLFSAVHVFGVSPPAQASPGAVWLLALLSFAAIALRTDCGVFSLLWGGGVSGRLTHILFWVILFLPILREALRARLVLTGGMPEESAASSLAASAIVFGMIFLVIIGYYFRRLENQIRELSLRDELTGLYNLRGFRLLADQAFRLAQRARLPFAVMFVDVDELKAINDELGHAVGSSLLIQTAELLRSSFRQTDVVGRIGGDEFAIAGHFDPGAISKAAERVVAKAKATDLGGGARPRPGLSIGYVSADPHQHESLEDLLAQADAAMYQQKRGKKRRATL